MITVRSLCPILAVLVVISVMIAGCTSPSSDPAPSRLPVTAHAEKTTVPVPEETPEPVIPAAGQTPEEEPEEVTVLSLPDASPGMIPFGTGDISLSYPDRFAPLGNTSLEKMREVARPQGIEILTILTAGDSKDSIQVTRQTAESSIEGIFNEKMAIANEVAVNGSANVISMTFTRYEVEKLTLPDGTGAVKVSAENSEKGTAVTYLLSEPGAIYNINFIYDSPERAESQNQTREALIGTLRLV